MIALQRSMAKVVFGRSGVSVRMQENDRSAPHGYSQRWHGTKREVVARTRGLFCPPFLNDDDLQAKTAGVRHERQGSAHGWEGEGAGGSAKTGVIAR